MSYWQQVTVINLSFAPSEHPCHVQRCISAIKTLCAIASAVPSYQPRIKGGRRHGLRAQHNQQ